MPSWISQPGGQNRRESHHYKEEGMRSGERGPSVQWTILKHSNVVEGGVSSWSLRSQRLDSRTILTPS